MACIVPGVGTDVAEKAVTPIITTNKSLIISILILNTYVTVYVGLILIFRPLLSYNAINVRKKNLKISQIAS